MASPFDQFDKIENKEEQNPFDQFDFLPQNQQILNLYRSGQLTPDKIQIVDEMARRGLIDRRVSTDLHQKEMERLLNLPIDQMPEWMRNSPILAGLYGAGKGVLKQVVRPTLENLGMIVGSIAGSPAAGGALGYGIGSKTSDILENLYSKLGDEEIPTRTIKGELLDSAIDVGTAYAIGKGLEVGQATLWAADQYLFEKLPERLYASATKMPLSKKWTRILPGKELTKRKMAVLEGLKTRTPPSEYGAKKAEALEKEVKQYIDDAVSVLDENPENILNTEDIINRGLKRAYAKAENSSDPIGAKQTVDDIAEKFRAHGQTLTPSKANAIKRQLYDEVKWGGSEATAIQSQLTTRAKKGMAHELMKDLEKLYPELKTLNQKDAARINLKEAIERAAGRELNTNMVKLGPKVLMRPKTWPLAIIDGTIGHPQVKARIAFALAKANPSKYSQFVYPEMPKGYVPPIQEIEKGVYRYSPQFEKSQAPKPTEFKPIIRKGEPKSKVKNKMEEARRNFEEERIKYLEQRFKELEEAKSKIGSPLMRDNKEQLKAPKPKTVEELLSE